MHDNIEQHAKILIEFLVRTHQYEFSLIEARRFKKLESLYEAVSQKDIIEDIKKTKAAVKAFADYFPTDVAAGIAGQLEKLADSIPDTSNLSTALFSGDEEKIKKLAKQVSTAATSASSATSATYNAVISLRKALDPYFDKLDEEEKDMSIGLLADTVKSNPEEWQDKFIDRDSLEKGIKKAFVPQQSYYDKFQKGIAAAKSQAGADAAKSDTGKLFATAAKFLVGFTKKSASESFPKLLDAFKQFMEEVSVRKFMEISDNLLTKGKGTVDKTTSSAAESSSSVATVAGGAPVEKSSDEENENVAPQDIEGAASAAEKTSQNATTQASKDTLGSSLNTALIDYFTPFQNRKNVSGTAKKSIEDATASLRDAVTKELNDSAELTSDGVKRAIESWFNGLDPKVKKNLGGPKGSEKIVKTMANNIMDIVKKNFALKQERKMPRLRDIILVEDKIIDTSKELLHEDRLSRWQKMAGIK